MDRNDENGSCENASTADKSETLQIQTNISAQTAKDIESLMKRVEFRPAVIQETHTSTPDGHIEIDPEVRERIANPKYPVRMPEKPFENLSYHDSTRQGTYSRGPSTSRVNGLFGRQWRETIEREQSRAEAEEDKQDEDDRMMIRDNICPTFMIWGVCHRGDRCELRHPSYRYVVIGFQAVRAKGLP